MRDGGARASSWTERPRALTPGEIAWIALLPCALVAAAAIFALGPPLGHLLVRHSSDALWPPGWWEARGRPEPAQQGRYVIAVLAPLLLAGIVLASPRRAPQLRPRTIGAMTVASHLLVLALVVVAFLAQRNLILTSWLSDPRVVLPDDIFSIPMIVISALLVLTTLIALRHHRIAAALARLARETTARRAAGLAIAAAFAAVWLLKEVTTDRIAEDVGQMNWTLNDAVAVLNGRTPLVDYHVIYGKLMPYPAALAIATFGKTAFVYTLLMAVLSFLALLAVYGVFRRVACSSLLSLVLFMPFVAFSDYTNTMIVPAMWPMRYGGAYLMAWLTARRLERGSARHGWIAFLIGGLVAINTLEFGIAALLASAAALVAAQAPAVGRGALRVARDAVGGVLGAIALVSLLTLLRAGTLPNPALLLEWPRIFTQLGWFSLPMRIAGMHLVVYATFVAAIAVAAVRIARRDGDALLTGMLVWSGVFGLVAASYYVGRSDHIRLISMFSEWSFALSLLAIVSVRALTAQQWRRPSLPQLLVLFGVGLSLCFISRLSPPQEQIGRLTAWYPAPRYRPVAEAFVRQRTMPGETVAILLPESYRIADDLGLRNVAPYGIQNAIVTRSQMRTLIDTLRREHVRELFLPNRSPLTLEGEVAPAQLTALAHAGFPVRSREPGFIELRRAAP